MDTNRKRIEFCPGKEPDPKTAARMILEFGLSLDGPNDYVFAVQVELAKLINARRAEPPKEG